MTPEEQLAERVMQYKRERYPNVPEHAISRPIIRTNNTNNLSRAIQQSFEVFGCYVTRIQSQGQYDPILKRFRKGHTKKGTADFHGIVNGRHLSIEVKYGRDKMSPAQRETAEQVQASGGIYYVAQNFADFWIWFNQLLSSTDR